jgi:putative aldouronate transport system substrate-binding protein
MNQPKKRSQIVAVPICAALLATVGVGAGTSIAAASPSGSSPTTISMFGAEPNTVINVETNWFTKYAEKMFGINFSFDTTPSQDVATKLPVLLASGGYPDVIWNGNGAISQADAEKYGSQGVFVPLNSLLKEYAPNVWAAIQTDPGYKQYVTSPNGDIYALPAYNYCYHCDWDWNDYINIADLAKYGLSMPRTTAQFENALEVFKAHGIVPMSGATNIYNGNPIPWLMNAFIPYNGGMTLSGSDPGDAFVDVNSSKQLYFIANTPQWKAGLSYIAGLFAKGLITDTSLTQPEAGLSDLIAKNDVGAFPNGADETVILNYGSAASHYNDWLSMPALKGPSGAQYAAFGPSIGPSALTFAITNKASSAVEKGILELVNFMYTPKGAEMEDFGPQGVDWTPAAKGIDGLIPEQALFNTNWNAFYSGNSEQNEGWNQWGPIDQSYQWRNLNYSPAPFTSNGAQAKDQLTELVDEAGYQPQWQLPTGPWVPQSEDESYAIEQTNIDSYVTEWMDEFATGQKSISADWSSYVSGLKGLGLSNYMSVVAQAVKASGGVQNSHVPLYEPLSGDAQYLLTAGPVPTLTKKYLLESGVPASDFTK